MTRFLISTLLFSATLTWGCSYEGKNAGSVVNDVKDSTSNQSQMTFHLNLPSEIRNNVLSVLIGCEIANGAIQNVFFDKQEILAGVKIIRQERSIVKSCESSLIVEPHALPKSETDTPVWAPPGFGVINQKFDKIEDFLEIGLGDWKVQTLSIVISREAFEKRRATQVLLNFTSDGYLFRFPDSITQLTKENAPQTYTSRILYKSEPIYNVSPLWLTNDGFLKEKFVTKNPDIRID